MRTPLALLLLAAPLVAAPVPKALKKTQDEVLIVGVWVSSPGDKAGWAFYDDGTSDTGVSHESKKAVRPFLYKLDPTQSPKHMDWSQDGGKTWYLAIYELDGDSLKINFGTHNSGVRPTVLGPNNGFQWENLTRLEKPK